VYVYDPAQYYRPANPVTDLDTNDQEACQNWQGQRRYRYTTTFILYEPDDTPDFFGDDREITRRSFVDNGTPDYHNKWFRVGTISYSPVGHYRLQVVTNDPNGVGRNQYSLALGGPRAPTNEEFIYGIDKMSIFNNIRNVPANEEIEWYLAKVPGEHAGERMSIEMFDPGDASCPTYIQLWQEGASAPTDFNLNWTGQIINTLQTTTAGGQRPYNGQWVTLGVELPGVGQYFDSWWKVRYIVGGCRGTSTDRTVWKVELIGSPIHNELPP
jgi:hypothetical protein